MEIKKIEAILNAKIYDAFQFGKFGGDFKSYARTAIRSNDLEHIAYAAYALGYIMFRYKNENAASGFKLICDYVYDESEFSDEELWAFHEFID